MICPSMFCRWDELGLEAAGQLLEPDHFVAGERGVEPDGWCRWGEGGGSRPYDLLTRHESFRWRPQTLLVTVRGYRCCGCGHVWRRDIA